MSGPVLSRQEAERRGRRAETLAAWWLTLRGYRVVARNLRTPPSEVDILALRGRALVVVEVKARESWQACEESLDWHTRRRLDRAARWLSETHPLADGREVRIDAVHVVGWRVRHIADAWKHNE